MNEMKRKKLITLLFHKCHSRPSENQIIRILVFKSFSVNVKTSSCDHLKYRQNWCQSFSISNHVNEEIVRTYWMHHRMNNKDWSRCMLQLFYSIKHDFFFFSLFISSCLSNINYTSLKSTNTRITNEKRRKATKNWIQWKFFIFRLVSVSSQSCFDSSDFSLPSYIFCSPNWDKVKQTIELYHWNSKQ